MPALHDEAVSPAAEGTRRDACPVCSLERAKVYVAFPEVEFSRCFRCGVVYRSFERADLLPEGFYEKDYFHGRKSGRDRRFEHRVRKAMRQIRDMLRFKPLGRLLDIGCSFGYVIEGGKRLGMQSAGVDLSAYAVEVCKSRGYRAEVGSLESLPFGAAEFDAVFVRHTLEHTPTPKEALASIGRVLAPGGLALVVVPDLDYWKGRLLRKSYRYFRPDDLGQQHFVYYTASSLRKLLEGSGYRVLASSKAVPSVRAKGAGALLGGLRLFAAKLWTGLGSLLHLRRELYFVVEKA